MQAQKSMYVGSFWLVFCASRSTVDCARRSYYWIATRVFVTFFPGAPNVTNITFTGQTTTLTCTSTGGPATMVTWRRDEAVITLNATYQQTKTVIDNSTSIYQTVLTIDPSVSQSDIVGTYNCTVENARGRSSMAIVAGELFSCGTLVWCV